MLRVFVPVLAGVLAFMGASSSVTVAHAGGIRADLGSGGTHAAVTRPISDFVNAQGSTNGFLPPIPDFVGWTDDPPNGCNSTQFASVDYAGVAAAWLVASGGPSYGTTVGGSVTERPLADGRADVTVVLTTSNAITWVEALPPIDFANDPPTFGYKANALLANPSLQPALSTSLLQVEFTNTGMGAALPDIVTAFILGEALPGQSLLTLSFRSSGSGPLHANFGVPEGTPGSLNVSQTGLILHTFKGCVGDAFPAEIVNLRATGGAVLVSQPIDLAGPARSTQSASTARSSHSWGQLKLMYR
jgi:hypothetical protein